MRIWNAFFLWMIHCPFIIAFAFRRQVQTFSQRWQWLHKRCHSYGKYQNVSVCLFIWKSIGVKKMNHSIFSSKQGNTERENYILTQSPLKETVADLWRLLKDYNSSTIVMLNQTSVDQVQYFSDFTQNSFYSNFILLCFWHMKMYHNFNNDNFYTLKDKYSLNTIFYNIFLKIIFGRR